MSQIDCPLRNVFLQLLTEFHSINIFITGLDLQDHEMLFQNNSKESCNILYLLILLKIIRKVLACIIQYEI